MARKTMEKKFEDAKKKYEKQLAELGKELAQNLVDLIAPLIPKGWYLSWHQSDEQYDDENYYFGLDSQLLVSDRVPRQGKLLKAEVPTTYKTETSRWGGTTKVVDNYGSPAEYEWHLDDTCKKRSINNEEWDEPGVLPLEEADDELGLDADAVVALRDMFESIDDEDFERAFGDDATVRVYHDGTHTVH